MKRLVNALILFTSLGLGCKADSRDDPGMVYGFGNIEPSDNLTWTSCFDDFTCARLEVPLDYSNESIGTTSIAFIKLAGKNATAKSPSIVLIPGGPGGSGVDLLLTYRAIAGQIFGEQYNFVSFDPRGVNNSGPSLDCFSGNADARLAFSRLHRTGATNTASTSLEEQYYSSSIYGEWCNDAVKNEHLMDIIGRGRVIRYGTVVGTTFASMFPDRVGRMILDGVLNAEQYYENDWKDTVDQMDETMEKFATFCHSAGPETCSFWGPTPADIMARLDGIIHQLQDHPVPLSGVQSRDLPTMVTYSDLKALFINTIYEPLSTFPVAADILHQLEGGNVSALAGMFDGLGDTSDARLVIQCADSYRRNTLTTIEEFKSYAEYTTSKSRARKMYSRFPGSVLLLQEAVGPTCRPGPPVFPKSTVFRGSAIPPSMQAAWALGGVDLSVNEISWVTRRGAQRLYGAGVTVRNQSVLLNGVNNSPEAMCALVHELGNMNVQPYYMYQGDVVPGAEDLRSPMQHSLDLERAVRGQIAGFLVPSFILDLPAEGGKRLTRGVVSYDRHIGLSKLTAPGLKGEPVEYE
ncbi:hypothetical protein SCUP234_11406 [Seiridium cupressi]